MEAFVAASCLYTKFDCLLVYQRFLLQAAAYDCESGLLSLDAARQLNWAVCIVLLHLFK